MEELTAILQLAGKYGTPVFFVGGGYLVVKLTAHIIKLTNRLQALETQMQLNKARIDVLERDLKYQYERSDFGDIGDI